MDPAGAHIDIEPVASRYVSHPGGQSVRELVVAAFDGVMNAGVAAARPEADGGDIGVVTTTGVPAGATPRGVGVAVCGWRPHAARRSAPKTGVTMRIRCMPRRSFLLTGVHLMLFFFCLVKGSFPIRTLRSRVCISAVTLNLPTED